MISYLCSQCDASSSRHCWGSVGSAREGWRIAPTSAPRDFAERRWLCPQCCARADDISQHPKKSPLGREGRAARHPLRVLVVDDQELVLRATARMLSSGFQTVVPVGSSKQALEMLRSGSDFDAVVSDVMMPEMNGPDLFACCYLESQAVAHRFIFASGEPSTARELLTSAVTRVGSSYYPPLLEKPMSLDTLVTAVLMTASYTEPKSGTFSLRDDNAPQVRKYRG